MMMMMKMGWMQISIVYRHLDLWPGCEKGKWYLLHMITTLLLYATLFWEDFSIFWGKLHAFLYMITLLFPIKRYVIQLFLPHRACVPHDFLENIWSARWLQRSDRGKTRGTLLPVIYDSGLTKGYHEHPAWWTPIKMITWRLLILHQRKCQH